MSNEGRDVDALLRRSIEGQLVDFDWAGLSRNIDGRVTSAAVRSGSWNRYGRWIAVAAGVALMAGVLAFVMIRVTRPGRPPVGNAIVAMVETARPAGSAQVSFSPARTPVRCEVKILASDKPEQQKSQTKARWCIIARQEPSIEKRRSGRDASDVLCLF